MLYSSFRLSPSYVCPHLTLCTHPFTSVYISIPPVLSFFLAPLPPVLSPSLPSTIFSSPVRFSLCVSATHSVTPITPSLPSFKPSTLIPLSCLVSISSLSFSPFIHIHPLSFPFSLTTVYSFIAPRVCPLPHLCLTHFNSHTWSFLCPLVNFSPTLYPSALFYRVVLSLYHLCPPCFFVSVQVADKLRSIS